MRGRHVQAQLRDQTRESWRLAFGQVEHQPREGGGVDDRVLERALEPTADQPGVESVVAVLDQHRAVRETQESATRVLEFRCSDEHRPIDVVALARVRIDGSAAVDERVEEGKRAFEGEALSADLENQEGRVARRLHVERHELRVLERGAPAHLRRVDRDLFPRHQLRGAAWFQEKRFWTHRASARARRAHAISSPVSARNKRTAAA
jgi:hypothetical protein